MVYHLLQLITLWMIFSCPFQQFHQKHDISRHPLYGRHKQTSQRLSPPPHPCHAKVLGVVGLAGIIFSWRGEGGGSQRSSHPHFLDSAPLNAPPRSGLYHLDIASIAPSTSLIYALCMSKWGINSKIVSMRFLASSRQVFGKLGVHPWGWGGYEERREKGWSAKEE